MIEVRMLQVDEARVLAQVADDVFDNPVDPQQAAAFLADPRHHLAVAIDAGQVVGFASGVDYLHPDKPPELCINEVGVAPSHQGRGLGKRLMACLLAHGETLGCASAWVLTEQGNRPARALYEAAGGVREPDESDADGQVVLYAFGSVSDADSAGSA
ncbi:N-acetyltransferase family protein [Blastomonas sp.]|uniref:N-acetyltransferase family protein n=1 Tax=Blastomonas sp. TaxID=1909299 RepID=UPI00406A2C75